MCPIRAILLKGRIFLFIVLVSLLTAREQLNAAADTAAPSKSVGLPFAQEPLEETALAFVSDRDEPGNWDIYTMDIASGVITRLTTDPAIDNHPDISHDGTKLLWTSTRGAGVDFDIYVADLTDVEGTAKRLTFDEYPNGPQAHYPDRHPHWSHDGTLIVFDSKNRPLDHPIEVKSECCVPIIIIPPKFFENLNVIKLTPDGSVETYVQLDIRDAWDSSTFPEIWRDDTATYVGHASFSADATKILFAAAIDVEGTVWEVYTVGFDPSTLELVANSLRRITKGTLYPPNPNPIQMSGGAHFTHDGSRIIYSSTQTTRGNSRLFWARRDETDLPVQSSRGLTWGFANYYVPEPLPDGRIVATSDGGMPSFCDLPPDVLGPTLDLDIVIMNADGSGRTNLTDNDTASEMLLIADEVSWFCGLSPNLTSCTFQWRIMNLRAWWLMLYSYRMIPTDLLKRFNISDAPALYSTYCQNINEWVQSQPHLHDDWQMIQQMSAMLMETFPGFEDPELLKAWLAGPAAQVGDLLFVLPSKMREGIGDRSLFDPPQPQILKPVDNIGERPDMIIGILNLWATERGGLRDDQVVLARFDFSNDGGRTYLPIGEDDDGTVRTLSTVEDTYQDNWWNAQWDTSGLKEGQYLVKVTMFDKQQNSGEDIVEVYVDPTPPIPTLERLKDHQVFDRPTELFCRILDEDIVSVIWEVQLKPLYYTKGIPLLDQHDYGAGKANDGNAYCAPTGSAASLKWWASNGYPGLAQDVVGNPLTDTQLVEGLATAMGTSSITGTSGAGVVNGLRQWVNTRGLPLTVKDHATISPTTIRDQVENCKEDVVLGIYWNTGGGHLVTVNSIANYTNPDGTTSIDLMDPWTGAIVDVTMEPDGDVQWPGKAGVHATGLMVTVSPTKPRIPWILIGEGPSFVWDPTSLPPGLYFVRATVTDSMGNQGSSQIVGRVVPPLLPVTVARVVLGLGDTISLEWEETQPTGGPFAYTVEFTELLPAVQWKLVPGEWPIPDTSWSGDDIAPLSQRYYRVKKDYQLR